MSMFSGFTNQISGWVATKTGGGQPPTEEDPNAQMQQQILPENGAEQLEEGAEAQQAPGGVAGFAKGLMQKGFAVKDNLKEKAAVLSPQNLQGLGSNLMGGITNLMPGRKEEEVPTPPEPLAPTEMGGEMMMEGDQQYLQE